MEPCHAEEPDRTKEGQERQALGHARIAETGFGHAGVGNVQALASPSETGRHGQGGSGGRIRTYDQRINSPLRYRCATPEHHLVLADGQPGPPLYQRGGSHISRVPEVASTLGKLHPSQDGCSFHGRSAMEHPPRERCARMASWRSGYAEDCKSLYGGSIPSEASIFFQEAIHGRFRASAPHDGR